MGNQPRPQFDGEEFHALPPWLCAVGEDAVVDLTEQAAARPQAGAFAFNPRSNPERLPKIRHGRGACLNDDRRESPGRAAAGPPPHPQGAQHKGAEEHDDADEQQEQQAFRDHAHDAQHDRRDHQQ
jgi:hypothetical protein